VARPRVVGQDDGCPAQIVQMMLELMLREWEEQFRETHNSRKLWKRRMLAAKMALELRDNVLRAAWIDGGKVGSDFEEWWSSRG